MKKSYLLRLRAAEPLIITSGSAQSMAHETLDHIPGSMLLGALAEVWKRRNRGVDADSSESFRRMFLDGGVFWGNAVPSCGGGMTVPAPHCYNYVKGKKSLPVGGGKFMPDEHAVINFSSFPMAKDGDPSCSEEGDSFAEILRRRGLIGIDEKKPKYKKLRDTFIDPVTMRQIEKKRGWNMHVTLGDQRSAVEGQLFGYSSIAAGTEFTAEMLVDEDLAETFCALFGSVTGLRVGRCRSAGCGLLECTGLEPLEASRETLQLKSRQPCKLFLRSHYVPRFSWESPMDGLVAELKEITGSECQVKRSFASFYPIAGWNSLWRKPRTTRDSLEQGSVLEVSFDNDVCLDRQLALGADQREGYGRIWVDPPFLAKELPEITDISAPLERTPRSGVALTGVQGTSPAWKSMRRRAILSACEACALDELCREDWKKFVETAARSARPTQSQRGYVRTLVTELEPERWKERFEHILKTSAGKQWTGTFSWDPWRKRNEDLDVLMLNILDPNEFFAGSRFEEYFAGLPGGKLSEEESKDARLLTHRIFLTRMLADWGAAWRAKGEKEEL